MKRIDESKTNKQDDAAGGIRLHVPWAIGSANVCQSMSRGRRADEKHFVSERSRVHETYIREQEKTKRLNLVLAAVCFIAGCIVIVFGPSDRKELSNWIGAALLIVSAGTAGYKRVWGKTNQMSFGADDGGKGKST